MRKPPDKPGQAQMSSLSEREVDTSNATLNTLFGGSHQKSWMTGGIAPVRPTPRRTPSSAPQVSATVASSLPPPRPRISPNSTRKSTAPVLPSPTPSDEPNPDFFQPRVRTERSDSSFSRPSNDEISRPQNINPGLTQTQFERPHSQVQSNIPSSRQPVEPNVIQRVNALDLAMDDRPAVQVQGQMTAGPSSIGRRISTEEQGSAAQLLQSPSPDIVTPTLEEAELVRGISSGFEPTSSNFVMPPARPAVSYGMSQWGTGREEVPSPVQTNASPPPGSSNQSMASSSFRVSNGRAQTETHRSSRPPAPSDGVHIQKRQRTQAPVMPSLRPRVVLINAHIDSVGGDISLDQLERSRFNLLKDACIKEDGFYVATHQIFCTWDVDWTQVASIPGFPSQETLRVAFKILGQLIRDNGRMAQNHIFWFSQFPSPLIDLLRSSEPYRRTVQSVGRFLTRLAGDWVQFASDTRCRNYPPLVDELVNRLNILSPIFQGIVFTATRRNLGVVDDAVGDQMERMFFRDRHEHQALSARMNTDRPPTEREISERNGNLAVEYSVLLGHVRRRPSSVANGASLAQVPMPSNAHQQAVSSPGMNPSIQRLQHPSPFLSNYGSTPSSPDIIGNGQSSVGPPLRTQAGGTVNESGRHPSTNSPQLNSSHTSPSPHLMQNPSFVNQQQVQTPVVRSNNLDSPMEHNIQQWGPSGCGPPNPTNHEYHHHHIGVQHPSNQASQQMPPQGFSPPVTSSQQHPPMQERILTNQERLTQSLQTIAAELHHIGQTRSQRSGLSGPDPQQFEQSMLSREQDLLNQQAHLRQTMAQWQQMGHAPNQAVQNPQYQYPHNQRNSHNAQNSPNPQVALEYQAGPEGPSQQPQYRHANAPGTQNLQNPLQPQQRRNNSMSAAPPPRRPGRPRIHNLGMGVVSQGSIIAAGMMSPPHPIPLNSTQMILEQTKAYMQTPILDQTIIPPYHYPYPQGAPAPHMTALHQAHLRSPQLIPSVPNFPTDMPRDHPDRRFYQVVKKFAISPFKLRATAAVATFEFSISNEELSMVARRIPTNKDSSEIREFVPGSLQYRLRCIERKNPGEDCPKSEWVCQDTSWPLNAVFQLGSGSTTQQIELRRKKLHGKDLPVDLTAYILTLAPDARIQITMSMPGRRQVLKDNNFFFGVEVIEIMAHRQILEDTQSRRKSARVTMESIQKSLTGPDLGDDDVALVSSELTLDITDPFSARMFEIPVRGYDCLHRECFDLETYLLSRPSKPNRKGQPSLIDAWKCPLCKGDTRPQNLYVDEYLVEIRRQLEEQGRMDTKAIIVDMHGNWRPKDPPTAKRKSFNHDSDSEDEDDLPENGMGRQMKSTSVVIDISD